MSLKNKIDFAVVFSVKFANPNGDPLNGNRPRQTYDGHGEVSDVCIKRKLRDRLSEAKIPVFVQSDDRKVDEFPNLKARAEAMLKNVKEGDREKYAEAACKAWYDVRAFGQVFAFASAKKSKKDKKKTDDAEVSESTDGVSVGIRGPVTVQSAFSVETVDVMSLQITKSVSNESDGAKKGSDTMGMKHRVDSGVYVFRGSINPQLAEKTGFSGEDAEILKSILPKMFENDASSARPEGSIRVMNVIWWDHGCPNGKISSARIHNSFDVAKDGTITFKEDFNGVKREVIPGF